MQFELFPAVSKCPALLGSLMRGLDCGLNLFLGNTNAAGIANNSLEELLAPQANACPSARGRRNG